jgi:hypothetical protein
MMVSLLRARNALQNQRSDSAIKEKWFGGKETYFSAKGGDDLLPIRSIIGVNQVSSAPVGGTAWGELITLLIQHAN